MVLFKNKVSFKKEKLAPGVHSGSIWVVFRRPLGDCFPRCSVCFVSDSVPLCDFVGERAEPGRAKTRKDGGCAALKGQKVVFTKPLNPRKCPQFSQFAEFLSFPL